MKNSLAILIAFFVLAISGAAQEAKVENPPPPPEERGQMLRDIGLSPDQLRELRRLNMERKPLMEAAQRRLREANRLLDEAIYADAVDESAIQKLLKDAQDAHADVLRIRSTSELAIRRILTPEQLANFRELRQRFEASRRDLETRSLRQRRGQGLDPSAGPAFQQNPKRLRPFLRQGRQEKQP